MHSAYYQKQMKRNRLEILFFENRSKNISKITKVYVITKQNCRKIYNIELSIKDKVMQI